jgi:hypothetical protein
VDKSEAVNQGTNMARIAPENPDLGAFNAFVVKPSKQVIDGLDP